MYKTIYMLEVCIKGEQLSHTLDSDVAAVALNQIKAGRDIDVPVASANAIVPYHAIEYALVHHMRPSVPAPEDDNLKNCTGGEVATGTLTIRNSNNAPSPNVIVNLMRSTPATYSGIEFSVVQEMGTTFIRGTIPSIAAGASFDLEGIPVGTGYYVDGATPATGTGVIPAEVVLRYIT